MPAQSEERHRILFLFLSMAAARGLAIRILKLAQNRCSWQHDVIIHHGIGRQSPVTARVACRVSSTGTSTGYTIRGTHPSLSLPSPMSHCNFPFSIFQKWQMQPPKRPQRVGTKYTFYNLVFASTVGRGSDNNGDTVTR